MKIEEAISNLEYLIGGDCCDTQMGYVEEIETSIKALRKQIPMKPIIDSENICPYCGITINEDDEYCFDCGQKMDWSED